MNNFTKKIYNVLELTSFCLEIRQLIFSKSSSIILLYGDLGAGKTTMIQCLLNHMITTSVSSPTFGILNIYHGYKKEQYLHFDLYRKSNITMEELREIGLDLLYENANNHCFIEWPERINDINMNHYTRIMIEKCSDYRSVTVNI